MTKKQVSITHISALILIKSCLSLRIKSKQANERETDTEREQDAIWKAMNGKFLSISECVNNEISIVETANCVSYRIHFGITYWLTYFCNCMTQFALESIAAKNSTVRLASQTVKFTNLYCAHSTKRTERERESIKEIRNTARRMCVQKAFYTVVKDLRSAVCSYQSILVCVTKFCT